MRALTKLTFCVFVAALAVADENEGNQSCDRHGLQCSENEEVEDPR